MCESRPELLVDDDAPAGDHFRVGRVDVVGRTHGIVVDNKSCAVLDLDPELVRAATAVDLSVVRGEREAVSGLAVDGACALVLSLEARDNEHAIGLAVEVERGKLE